VVHYPGNFRLNDEVDAYSGATVADFHRVPFWLSPTHPQVETHSENMVFQRTLGILIGKVENTKKKMKN
jgi:hypothetical protein